MFDGVHDDDGDDDDYDNNNNNNSTATRPVTHTAHTLWAIKT
jgi:hypothetical protein